VPLNSVDTFLRNQSSPKTETTYRWALEKWFTWLSDREITEVLVLGFRKYLEDTLSTRSAALVFNTVRVYYRWMGTESPFLRIKSPKRVQNATPVIPEDSLVDNMLEKCYDLRDKAIISLALNGLRASEIVNLRKESFWYSEEYQTWLLRVIGKGNRERVIPATAEAIQNLAEYAKTAPEGREWLIEGKSTPHLTYRQVEYVMEKWSKAAGSIFRPHKLRHFFATKLIRNGADVTSIQKLLGHSSIQSTQIYTHLRIEDIVRVVKTYDEQNKDGYMPSRKDASSTRPM
jgi:site-specific recombinase XerD